MKRWINAVVAAHAAVFAAVERATSSWLPGLAARLVFASVLLGYYWNSALTKVGSGLAGLFPVADNAYYQIAPHIIEAAGYDVSNVAVFPWKIIVHAGTYAEFLLPLAVTLGLFARLAALGMTGFILVQTLVDITLHKIGAEATGSFFDRFPDAMIADQRLLWLFPLLYLVVKGAGLVSVDALLVRLWKPAAPTGRATPLPA
ncbi:MAG: DoxX family membrane protein [Notoacmeibacter sp.]|nr:DoxX family membrane protein [Notoacmeibacter sp.]MCC0032868.1 DoxX family membrane protein [Brucellaceae bacterium]